MMPLAESRKYSGLDDSELVRLCLDRDEDAWRALLERYARLIYSIPVRRGLDADQADEVFQSVAATLVERLPFIQDPQCLPKWLVVTTIRRAQLIAARTSRLEGLASVEDRAAPGAELDTELAREEMRVHVQRGLQELEERDREVLLDLFDRELPYAEIARKHRLRVGSLGSLRARALARLRRILERKGVL